VSDPWLGLLLVKMMSAAGIVVGCSLIAERSGPLLAAMIATLPISIGPVLVFLALDHDATFLSQAVFASMGANLATAAMVLVHVLMAQRHGTMASLGTALALWAVAATAMSFVQLPPLAIILASILAYGGLHRLFRPYLDIRPAAPPARLWYAIPLRAGCVALLAGTVTVASSHVGSAWSGTLAALPVVFSSLIAMLQPLIGGPAMAAIVANSALGLMGFGVALAAVHAAAVPLGSWLALLLGLLISVGWNLALMGLRARRAPVGARRPQTARR
jgi:hypothetical protein